MPDHTGTSDLPVADHDLYLLKLASLLDAMERYAAGLPVTAFPPRFSLN